MNKSILFSPIGSADPISQGHEGSLLHIARHYKPDIIYLFLSEHFYKMKQEDERHSVNGQYSNRYTYALEQLSQQINHNFEIHFIEAKDLHSPHLFDPMLEVFSAELAKIQKQQTNPEIIYLNLSSGTPAMKNALLTLSIYNDYNNYEPLQVAGPKNRNEDSFIDYKNDYVALWNSNKDNQDSPKRFESMKELPNYSIQLEKKIVKNLIKKYDYQGVYDVISANTRAYSAQFKYLITGVLAKYQLDREKVEASNARLNDDYQIPLGSSENEYIILWNLKLLKLNEKTDYIRALSPTLVHIFNNIALRVAPELKQYQLVSDEGDIRWNVEKLENSNNQIYRILSRNYSNYKLEEYLTALQLKRIIDERIVSTNMRPVATKVNQLRLAEKILRNTAAHQTKAFNSRNIKKTLNNSEGVLYESIEDINRDICDLAEFSRIVKPDQWDQYEKLNTLLIELL